MPLFGRRLFQHPDDVPIGEQTFTIEHTGERYHQEELYEKVKKIYALERWTCEGSWRAGLTHREAYESEKEIRKSLPSLVPDYYHSTIFEIIYHNVKPLEKLAEEVSIILGQSFVIGEPVQFKKKKDTTIVKGLVERIEENDDPKKRTSERASAQAKLPSDKQMKNVKYSIRLSDDDTLVDHVLPSELQRSSLIPNREKLKTFIRAYAIRLGNRADSPWIFYNSSIAEKYHLKDRITPDIVEKFRKSSTITLEEILREQDRLARKQEAVAQADEKNNPIDIPNDQFDDVVIILSDLNEKSPEKSKKKSTKTPSASPPKKKPQSPSKAKKQLTLHDMKFTKNSGNHKDLLEKSSSPSTFDVAIPYSLLQKLDKTRRDRGMDSKFFQRIILQCARTLTDKQRLRLPDEYRHLIQTKFEELELKRRIAQMTDEEKKIFLQTKRLEEKPIEDLDLTFSKELPVPKLIESNLSISMNSIGDLLMICAFLTSCHSLFSLSFNEEIPKSTQWYLRSFRLDYLLNSSKKNFANYFLDILQILMKLLFKEDENRSKNADENDDGDDDEQQDQRSDKSEEKSHRNPTEKSSSDSIDLDKDIEHIYSIQLNDIPLTPFTCQELTRLYLSKEKDEHNQIILDKLANCETNDLTISEQIDLLMLLVNTITTDNELMSDYFEYLTRTMSEASRERNQLLAERRKAQEEESKQKKLQLQNGNKEKVSSKKPLIISPKVSNHGQTNDENHQTSPMMPDENGEIDHGNDDDLKSVLQRRRQMVAMSKELKEKREIEEKKLQLKQKRQLALQKAEQIYQDALLNLQQGLRIKPIGYDRHCNRYWFFRGHPGLFVEKGWIGSNIHYSAASNPSTPDISPPEKSIPQDQFNQWFIYDDENLIQQLVHSLNERGIREHNLARNLKKNLPFLHQEFEQLKKMKNSMEQSDDNAEPINDIHSSFQSELEDIETRLRLGSLGGFLQQENLLDWQTKLKQAKERSELAELLIQLQQTVAEKYATGIFNQSDRKSLQIWMNDCRTCRTSSRLYVLMLIFENSITWNKSTLGMKCKICRKKQKDELLLVCDQCCYGFHSDCLRHGKESMKTSANDLWYCPACRPTRQRRGKTEKKKINYEEEDDFEEMDTENQSNDLSDEDVLCCICGVDNDLIHCTQCRLYYHCQCHEPPLRCPPRSTTWICNNCRNGISQETKNRREMKKNSKQINTRSGTRKNYYQEEEEEESEGEEEDDDDDDDDSGARRRSKRLRRSEPSPVKKVPSTRRRSRLVKSISSSSSSANESEEEQEEDDHEEEEESEMDEDENDQTSNDSPSSN